MFDFALSQDQRKFRSESKQGWREARATVMRALVAGFRFPYMDQQPSASALGLPSVLDRGLVERVKHLRTVK